MERGSIAVAPARGIHEAFDDDLVSTGVLGRRFLRLGGYTPANRSADTAALRTCFTAPSKLRPGNASIVNATFCALRTREMSASSIDVSTCMSFRFAAMTNSPCAAIDAGR